MTVTHNDPASRFQARAEREASRSATTSDPQVVATCDDLEIPPRSPGRSALGAAAIRWAAERVPPSR